MSKKSLHSMDMLESEEDFADAYKSYGQRIFRFLFWRTKDTQLSEDLTSSTFEKAWRYRDSFGGGSVQAWLFRIARNTLTDHWRKKSDVPLEDLEVVDETSDNTATQLDLEREVNRLQTAVQTLPTTMQDVVRLRFIEELSVRQVAKQLGLSESNVRVIQYRALKQIKKELS